MPTNTSRHTTPARSSAPVAAALMRQDSPCVATGGARAARGSHPGAACQEKASTNASLPCLRRSSGRSASTASSAPRAKASIGPRVPGTRISTSSARSCLHAAQQRRQCAAHQQVADADGQLAPHDLERRGRPIVDRYQLARDLQQRRAIADSRTCRGERSSRRRYEPDGAELRDQVPPRADGSIPVSMWRGLD